MTRAQFRIAIVQVLSILVILLPFAGGAYWVRIKMQTTQNALSSIEPMYARLLGLDATRDQLAQSAEVVQSELTKWVYPATVDATQTANAAQERIRAVFTDSKLDVASIQLTEIKEDGPFDQTGILVKVEGDLSAVQNALASIDILRPHILVDGVSFQVVGGVRPGQPVRLSVQVSMLFWRIR